MLAHNTFGCHANDIFENSIGEFSALYILKLAEREVVLKVAPKEDVRILRYEKNAMAAEVEALRLVKAQTNMPVPEVLFYDTSKTLCDSEYFFAEKMDGENFHTHPSFSQEERNDITFQLGELNQRINEIEHSKFGYLAQPSKQTNHWADCFSGMITGLLADAKDMNVKLPVREVEGIMQSFIHACDDVKTPKLVHWDLWPGNVLVRDNKISGIIDFERALYGDVLLEYFFRKTAANEYFNSGYGIDFSGLDRNAKIRLALYDLYLALIWVVEYYYRGYGPEQLGWRQEQLVLACGVFEIL